MEGSWTIGELAELAGAALADEPVRVNGRVRELPNERLIRWYTTIGLLDPPVARRGRNALYGPRHLLQIVAVKRRQAAGLAIAAIQAELAGATEAALREIARLPEALVPGAPPATAARARRSPQRARFWAEPQAAGTQPRPADRRHPDRAEMVTATLASNVSADSADSADSAAEDAADAQELASAGRGDGRGAGTAIVPGIRLAAGVMLLLDAPSRAIEAADLAAIETAAQPLLVELRRRGLRPDPTETTGSAEPAPPQRPGRPLT